MEMRVGKYVIQSSFRKNNNFRQTSVDINSGKARNANTDTFTISPFGLPYSSRDSYFAMKLPSFSSEMRSQIMLLQNNFKQTIAQGNNDSQIKMLNIPADDYDRMAEWALEMMDEKINYFNKTIAKQLEDAGIPEDITFEFDYNVNSRKLEVTQVSDENYREKVETVLNNTKFIDSLSYLSRASRVMNGYISSIYYPNIAYQLEKCFGQDISDLYIDENGNIGGANENLQKALEAEKTTKDFDAYQMFDFPVNQIEAMLKRMISDENITENISHMGYDGKSIYTNDGEVQLGKELDPELFEDRKFIMRAAFSMYYTFLGDYDRWLNNEKMFN